MITAATVENRIKERCKDDFLFFTKYFFMQRFGRKFVVGEHHKIIADVLRKVYNGEITRLIINIAPRYGKTELAVKNFIAAGLAINPAAKFIHLSYSDDLALDNSEETKNIVTSDTFQALFPEVRIRKESKAKKKWYTTKGGGVYATSSAGQVTGFGAGSVDIEEESISASTELSEDDKNDIDEFTDIEPVRGMFGGALVIDDPIKPEDADSELIRERINLRFDSTISNRVNSRNTPIVIIMQRLHERDLCGYLIDNEPQTWTVISLPSINSDGTALWPFKHTIEELRALETRNPIVFERQHLQRPMPIEGRLYKSFKTYEILPNNAKVKKAVIDTADTGSDFLCSIVYLPTPTGVYLLDVYYTDKGMETTETEAAIQLSKHEVRHVKVESNNGGRSFARNVERLCREQGNYVSKFEWFHQKDNKHVRIFTQAAEVQNMVYYPTEWQTMWPRFASAVKSYSASGRNAHDDAPDCLTLIIETEYTKSKIFIT